MLHTISCIDLGSDCEDEVHGNTIDELISEIRKHAVEHHNRTNEYLDTPEVQGRKVRDNAVDPTSGPAYFEARFLSRTFSQPHPPQPLARLRTREVRAWRPPRHLEPGLVVGYRPPPSRGGFRCRSI